MRRGLRWSRTSQRCTRGRRSARGGTPRRACSPWRTATGWPSTSASTSTPSPCSLDPRRADEHRPHRRPEPSNSRSASKLRDLAPEGVALGAHVEHAEVVAVEHDHPGAGAEHRLAARDEVAQRLGQALALDAERHRRGLAARDDEAVEPLEVLGRADRARLGAQLARASSRAPRSRPGGRARRRRGGAPSPAAVLEQAAAARRRACPISMPGHRARRGRARPRPRARDPRSASWPPRSPAPRALRVRRT